MKVFINDKLVKLKSMKSDFDKSKFNSILNNGEEIMSSMLNGDVLINNANLAQLSGLIKIMEVKKLKKLNSITLAFLDKDIATRYFKDQFKIITAAGGLVLKDEKYLLIHRLGVWDLPKGKLEKNETFEEGAAREVEEECGIKVEILEKIGTTWHTYSLRGKRILKKTVWYLMNCTDDSGLAPQEEEDILEVKWMDLEEAKMAIKSSYGSIQNVFNKYNKVLSTKY